MEELVKKLLAMEREIAGEKGPFIFFALLKEQSPADVWDLVICAEWIGNRISQTIDYVAGKLRKNFTPSERGRIMQIVIVAPDDPDLADVLDQYVAEHEIKKLRRGHYFRQNMERGFIFTARKSAAQLAAEARLYTP